MLLANIAMAGAASAATLSSGHLYAGGSNYHICVATNVGTKPIESVLVEVFDSLGDLVTSTTCSLLEPNTKCQAADNATPGSGYANCRFTIDGSKKAVRASNSVCVLGSCSLILPAL